MLQVFLAIAPVDALAGDSGFENLATSQIAPSASDGYVLSGGDPVRDDVTLAFEPGEMLASASGGDIIFARDFFLHPANTPATAGIFAHFYRGRAPPSSSLL